MVPRVKSLIPNPPRGLKPVLMNTAELEASRLVDLEGLTQEEAGERMGVSRGTVWRLLKSARRKTAKAITEGRPLQIMAGTINGKPEETGT